MEKVIDNLSRFRNWLDASQLDAFIIPHDDEFLGESIPEKNERLRWITGFTGSEGVVVVTSRRAAIFTDGRYTIQVGNQVPTSEFELYPLVAKKYLEWLVSTLPAGGRVGFDPKTHRATWLAFIKKNLKKEYQLVPSSENPIDSLWSDRPTQNSSKIMLVPDSISGQSSQEKRGKVASRLRTMAADVGLITQLDSICWLLNVRGSDIPRAPVILSYLFMSSSGKIDFFLDEERIPAGFLSHVGDNITVHSPPQINNYLLELKGKSVLFDASNSNAWFQIQLKDVEADIVDGEDPCSLLKSVKNPTELTGMKECHMRDGVAMVSFLHYLKKRVDEDVFLDEVVLSDRLENFRRQDPNFIDLSFDTISAVGSNAAMCHYDSSITPINLEKNTFYLVDSGGHYRNGTTDITRTISIGSPSAEMKKFFTLVLKGHIALATARFPYGTCGYQLDVLARQYLWSEGYDFDHGTGHGVGHCLSVHEGPQQIGKLPKRATLLPGMVVSNEPGYYCKDKFGIRIENLELIKEVKVSGEKATLGLEPLTRCPIDITAIDHSLLDIHERDWINVYHEKVWTDLVPLIEKKDVKYWLEHSTRPI